jgi:glutamate-1-semialdehyde 2,1-aminomutase
MLDRGRIREFSARESAALDERTPGSAAMFRRARRVLAGGIASSFQAREPWPIYLERGEGRRVWDLDANEFLDFHNGFSAMRQGHARPAIGAALGARYAHGTHFAAPTEDAVVVAEELARRRGLERWRFTNIEILGFPEPSWSSPSTARRPSSPCASARWPRTAPRC